MASKQKDMNLSAKIEIIKSVEARKSVRCFVAKYRWGKGAIYNILKRKWEYAKEFMRYSQNGGVKRLNRGPREENKINDEKTFEWFSFSRSKNPTISGPIVQEKAKEIATEEAISNFHASNGSLEYFCRRHNIVWKIFCGESKSVDEEVVAEWKEKLKSSIKGCRPENVYNADETCPFYRVRPSKTSSFKCGECQGGKHSKERLSALVFGNMTGEMESKMLVIGKAAKRRYLKRINIKQLPIYWVAIRMLGIPSKLMEERLLQFNSRMVKEDRHVLFFLDNATCHPHLKLSNVRLMWFLSNTTSRT